MLPLVLLVLVLISILSLVLLSMSALDPLISRNLAAAEQARFLAEGGIEWAFNTLRASEEWNAYLAGADPARGAVLAADTALPARPASEGTYTVRVRNDSMAGDQLVTGQPVDAGGYASDTNGLVIVTSVGSVTGGSRALQAVVQRIRLPLLPAALAFPGEKALVTVSGSFEIDGNDGNPDGTPGSCAPVFGISVSSVLPAGAPGANEAVVEALLAAYPTGVRGKRQDPARPPEGPNTVASDAALTPTEVQSFVRAVRNADVTLESSAPGGLSFNDIGAFCASDWSRPTCWGTADRPKVVRVRGRPDAASAVSTLGISGNTEGHGILIVEDAELWIQGNFRWHGAIIVTGSRPALGFLGEGPQAVYGAVVLNDTPADAPAGKGLLTGNARLRYSCQTLTRAQQARKLVTMRSWREVAQ